MGALEPALPARWWYMWLCKLSVWVWVATNHTGARKDSHEAVRQHVKPGVNFFLFLKYCSFPKPSVLQQNKVFLRTAGNAKYQSYLTAHSGIQWESTGCHSEKVTLRASNLVTDYGGHSFKLNCNWWEQHMLTISGKSLWKPLRNCSFSEMLGGNFELQ